MSEIQQSNSAQPGPSTLHEYVLDRLARSKGRWPEIARATGVSYKTLSKIASREIADPGVSHIERLARHFRQAELEAAASAPQFPAFMTALE
jgi:transcriptional regulator with XRE-family HTH domain